MRNAIDRSECSLCVCATLRRFGLPVCARRNYVIAATHASTHEKARDKRHCNGTRVLMLAANHYIDLVAGLLLCFRHHNNNNNSQMKEIYVVMWCGDCCARVCELSWAIYRSNVRQADNDVPLPTTKRKRFPRELI